MPRLSFCLYVSAVLHLSALLSSGVVLLEAGCACGCGAPFARTPPVLRFSNQHCRLSHRHSSSFRRRVLYQKKSSAWARPRSSSVSLPRLLPFASPSSTIFQPPRCVLSVSAVPVVPESPPLPLARCLHISPDDRREEPPKAGAMRGAHPPRLPRRGKPTERARRPPEAENRARQFVAKRA